MLPKSTHLWVCKDNEGTSLDVHSNESIDTDGYLILMMRWEIIYCAMMSLYRNLASMTDDVNEMKHYTEHW